MKKRLLTLLVGCVVLTGVFAGCSKKGNEESSKQPEATVNQKEEDKNTDKGDIKESAKDAETNLDVEAETDLEEKTEE